MAGPRLRAGLRLVPDTGASTNTRRATSVPAAAAVYFMSIGRSTNPEDQGYQAECDSDLGEEGSHRAAHAGNGHAKVHTLSKASPQSANGDGAHQGALDLGHDVESRASPGHLPQSKKCQRHRRVEMAAAPLSQRRVHDCRGSPGEQDAGQQSADCLVWD